MEIEVKVKEIINGISVEKSAKVTFDVSGYDTLKKGVEVMLDAILSTIHKSS